MLKDEHDSVCGILTAYTAFAEVYIEDLWVKKTCRGKGYGKNLKPVLKAKALIILT